MKDARFTILRRFGAVADSFRNESDHVGNRPKMLVIFFSDRDLEFAFGLHHKLDDIERIQIQFAERGVERNVAKPFPKPPPQLAAAGTGASPGGIDASTNEVAPHIGQRFGSASGVREAIVIGRHARSVADSSRSHAATTSCTDRSTSSLVSVRSGERKTRRMT